MPIVIDTGVDKAFPYEQSSYPEDQTNIRGKKGEI